MLTFLVLYFFSVKMYFQMLSKRSPAETAIIPVATDPQFQRTWRGANFHENKSKSRFKRRFFLVKPFVPHRKIGITGVIIWHQPKQMHYLLEGNPSNWSHIHLKLVDCPPNGQLNDPSVSWLIKQVCLDFFVPKLLSSLTAELATGDLRCIWSSCVVGFHIFVDIFS